mgnify:CR=1 FL=1
MVSITLVMTDDEERALRVEYQDYVQQLVSGAPAITFQAFVQDYVQHTVFKHIEMRQRHYRQSRRLSTLVNSPITAGDLTTIDTVLAKY